MSLVEIGQRLQTVHAVKCDGPGDEHLLIDLMESGVEPYTLSHGYGSLFDLCEDHHFCSLTCLREWCLDPKRWADRHPHECDYSRTKVGLDYTLICTNNDDPRCPDHLA